jgi:hypothetical protein
MPASTFGARLLTQNLLVSASSCEGTGALRWDAIHDLCVLIDLFCLYDELRILGRQAYSMYPRADSDFWIAIDNVVKRDDAQADHRIIEAACGHLGAYLGQAEDTEVFEPLFTDLLTPDSVTRSFSYHPDTEQDVAMGREWLQTLPPGTDVVEQLAREKDIHRPATFLVRTFLYLAYADAHRIPLTPDTARVPVLEGAKRRERNLRSQLLTKLNEQSREGSLTDDFGDLERVTPLASVVFERAWQHETSIPDEMRKLRDDLSRFRARIAESEKRLLWGNRKDELKASQNWQDIFAEIERDLGKGESLLKLSSLLGFAEGAVGAYAKPEDVKSWFKLVDLPREIIQRISARRSVIELHHLGDEMPSSGRLRWLVDRLFGDRLPAPPQRR